jgi:hypothetical protein
MGEQEIVRAAQHVQGVFHESVEVLTLGESESH